MSENPAQPQPTFPDDLSAIAFLVQQAALNRQNNEIALLALLRLLEKLHRDIRDGLFQDSLPDNRQALYNLLKDIEAEGGWPYIHRMRLQGLLSNLLQESQSPSSDDPPNS